MSVTARQIIYRACRHLGYAFQGSTIPADLESDALYTLNAMVEAWNLNRWLIPWQEIETYTLTANQTSFTIGSGGDFDGPRPLRIEQANIIINTYSPVLRKPMDIVDFRQWSAVQVQQVTAIPNILYYDGAFTSSLGKVYLWPQANQAYQIELFQWHALEAFAAAATAYNLPPGYERALIFNLAVELFSMAPDKFNRGGFGNVQRLAKESKDAVIDYNSASPYMSTDGAFQSAQRPQSSWNYGTGGFGNGPGSF
jgi:hypothetical protein